MASISTSHLSAASFESIRRPSSRIVTSSSVGGLAERMRSANSPTVLTAILVTTAVEENSTQKRWRHVPRSENTSSARAVVGPVGIEPATEGL